MFGYFDGFKTDSRVDDQLADGIAVEKLQQREKFLRVPQAEPGFDGDGDAGTGIDAVQQAL